MLCNHYGRIIDFVLWSKLYYLFCLNFLPTFVVCKCFHFWTSLKFVKTNDSADVIHVFNKFNVQRPGHLAYNNGIQSASTGDSVYKLDRFTRYVSFLGKGLAAKLKKKKK